MGASRNLLRRAGPCACLRRQAVGRRAEGAGHFAFRGLSKVCPSRPLGHALGCGAEPRKMRSRSGATICQAWREFNSGTARSAGSCDRLKAESLGPRGLVDASSTLRSVGPRGQSCSLPSPHKRRVETPRWGVPTRSGRSAGTLPGQPSEAARLRRSCSLRKMSFYDPSPMRRIERRSPPKLSSWISCFSPLAS